MKGFGANDFGFGSSNINGGGGGGYVPYIGATTNVDLGAFNLYATNIGIGTTSAGAPLDIHSTGTIVAQFNNVASTSAFLTFQSNSAGKWRIGNYYNATSNDFAIYDVVNSRYRVVLKNNGQLFFNNTNPISSTLTNRSAIWNTWDGLSGDGNAISNNVTYAGSGGATPAFTGYKANGTISAPTALLTNNVITQYSGFGYDGTDFYLGASIYHYAVSDWTSSSHETGIKMQLVPSGSAAIPSTYHTFTTLGFSASGTITANSNGAAPLTDYGLLNIYPSSSYSPTSMSNAAGLYGGSMTITDGVTAASGTVSLVPTNQFQVSTYNAINTSVTYTNAATMYISGAPVAGTNVTITNPYSLYIYSGLARLNGGFLTTSPSLFGGTSFSNTSSKLQISGAVTGPNTTIQGVHLALASNGYTDNSTAASGTASFATVASIGGQTFIASNTGVTYTNAASLYIAAAPIAGTNATITNSYAIYLAAGQSFFRGFYNIGNTVFGGSSATTSSNAKININGAVTGANTLTNGVHLLSAQNTYTDNSTAASGTAAWVVANSFQGIIAAASNTSVTYTNAANVYIEGNPIAGTNATITNLYALYANTGNVRFGGVLTNTGIAALNSRVNINGATDRSDFQLNVTGSTITQNTVTIPAAGAYGLYAALNATDTGSLTGGNTVLGEAGILNYTATANRTIANTNIVGAGLFVLQPILSNAITITLAQSTSIRALAALTAYFQMPSTADTSLITHAAGLRSFIQAANTANTYTITNYYGLLINSTTVGVPLTITNRYGIYQEGTSDINLLNGELRLGAGQTVSASVVNTVTNKIKLIVNGTTYYLLASTSAT